MLPAVMQQLVIVFAILDAVQIDSSEASSSRQNHKRFSACMINYVGPAVVLTCCQV
jgi:hypothetical protein